MEKLRPVLIVALLLGVWSHPEIYSSSPMPDTWANWTKRLDRAFSGIIPHKIPGRTMGILVPYDSRTDILPMSALGYETLSKQTPGTILILLPAPEGSDVDGLVLPSIDKLDCSVGSFPVDALLASQLKSDELKIRIDNTLFGSFIPPALERQLAMIKFILKKSAPAVKILPVFVQLSDLNYDVKDIAPFIAETLKDNGLDNEITVIMVGDISRSTVEDKLISNDSTILNSIRNMDVDSLMERVNEADTKLTLPNIGPLAVGILALKFLGADHGEILAYAHSGQLVLTKSKQSLISYAAGAISSGPPFPPRIPHVQKEKLETIFDELARSDILALARQTCASILDPTAAKPPALVDFEAAKLWPVYVSLYSPDGKLGGQAGSHYPVGPLEESVRKFSYKAVQEAKSVGLSKDNFKNWVIEVSIPHGFNNVSRPEDLIPLLNGIVVEVRHKKYAFHPEAWRTYPDSHQLLGSICTKIGLLPWDYATRNAIIESFRILAFNEKEPYQSFSTKKKRKRKGDTRTPAEEEDDGPEDTGDQGGVAFPF